MKDNYFVSKEEESAFGLTRMVYDECEKVIGLNRT
jgi:hypothetical protein